MIMCSIMLCSKLQRCLATPQTCVASAGKGKNASQAAIIATSRVLAACRNNSSTSICASTRSSTGWPTVAPPFSDHAITLGVPGHLAGTENRCPSPPTASFADQQQLSYHLHEWLEAALLQHANLNTSSCSHSEMEGTVSGLQPTAGNLTYPEASSTRGASSSSNVLNLQDKDWEHIQAMSVTDQTVQPVDSRSSLAASVSGGTYGSLDDLEVPMAGLSDAAVLQDEIGMSEASSSSSQSRRAQSAAEPINRQGVIVLGQDSLMSMEDDVSDQSSGESGRSSDGWSVVSSDSS